MPSYRDAADLIRHVLAAENGCQPEDFLRSTVGVFEAPAAPYRSPLVRRYGREEPLFTAVSMGVGAVVSGSAVLVDRLREPFAGITRDEVFETARLARVAALFEPYRRTVVGPHLRLLCGDETLFDRAPPAGAGVTVEAFPDERRLAGLVPARWSNAISLPVRRTTTRLAVAQADGAVVGLGATTADTEQVWQIGLDVREDWRGRGISAVLTSVLAREALAMGRIPFYGVAVANLASVRTALAAGFRPCWVEVYSVAPRA